MVNPTQRIIGIIWRKEPSQDINTYELNTVTYGTASAPYLAIRCLFQIAEDNANNYPKASKIIKADSYADDILSGADSVKDASKYCKEITSILQQAHFSLHK